MQRRNLFKVLAGFAASAGLSAAGATALIGGKKEDAAQSQSDSETQTNREVQGRVFAVKKKPQNMTVNVREMPADGEELQLELRPAALPSVDDKPYFIVGPEKLYAEINDRVHYISKDDVAAGQFFDITNSPQPEWVPMEWRAPSRITAANLDDVASLDLIAGDTVIVLRMSADVYYIEPEGTDLMLSMVYEGTEI